MLWKLQVGAGELAAGLDMFRRFLKSKKAFGDALVSLEGEALRIDLGGMTQKVPAAGEWPGEARIPGGFLLQMVPRTFPGDIVAIHAEENHLAMSSGPWNASAPATWEVSARPDDSLPLAPTMIDKIRFSLRHSPKELERMGVTRIVESALADADRLLLRAAAGLVELGITADDLRDLLKRKYDSSGRSS